VGKGHKSTKIYQKCAHDVMIEGGHKSILKSINKIGGKGTKIYKNLSEMISWRHDRRGT